MSFLARLLKRADHLFWTVALLTVVLDQASKILFWRDPASAGEQLVIIPHVLQFVPHEGNVRGALGLGPASPVFYVTAAVLGLVIIAMFYSTTPRGKKGVHVALGMLAGGAVGNLIDRILFGRVRVFVDLHWGESLHWHTFNLADAAICVGFLLVLADAFLAREQPVEGGGKAPRRASGR